MKGDTDYERYLRVPELVALQKPSELMAHPEEQLFQVTPHQSAERWLRQLDYEVDLRIIEELTADFKPGYGCWPATIFMTAP